MIGFGKRLGHQALELWRKYRPEFPWNRRYRTVLVEDLPDRLGRKTLYVVSERACPHYAAMACPHQRCATILTMNLLPDDHPQWELAVNQQGVPTLAPSVWRRTECACHFFLREGRIDWC